MSRLHSMLLTALALLAFAGNSLLCRAALRNTPIDAATFTSLRLISGALMLWALAAWKGQSCTTQGSWRAALVLFAYAACFSFAYTTLPASTGALVLFGAVQLTMISWALWLGERLKLRQMAGLLLAFAGLIVLLWPGLAAPPLWGTVLMLTSGIAWGIYSLMGKGAVNPLLTTAGNFVRSTVPALLLSAVFAQQMTLNAQGAALALASGALTSGLGYAVWYAALPSIKASQAAAAQLGVPVIAAFAAVPLLDEVIGIRLVLTSLAVLGGIALAIDSRNGGKPKTGSR